MMESINILHLQETESELMAYVSKKNEETEEEADRNINRLLQQKEKDLVLAAELGKALLEKNEDLTQQNEKMAEDFAKQLEVRQISLEILTCIEFFKYAKKWVGLEKDFPGFYSSNFVTLDISFTRGNKPMKDVKCV